MGEKTEAQRSSVRFISRDEKARWTIELHCPQCEDLWIMHPKKWHHNCSCGTGWNYDDFRPYPEVNEWPHKDILPHDFFLRPDREDWEVFDEFNLEDFEIGSGSQGEFVVGIISVGAVILTVILDYQLHSTWKFHFYNMATRKFDTWDAPGGLLKNYLYRAIRKAENFQSKKDAAY